MRDNYPHHHPEHDVALDREDRVYLTTNVDEVGGFHVAAPVSTSLCPVCAGAGEDCDNCHGDGVVVDEMYLEAK